MSAITRQHRPTHASPRPSRRRGIVTQRADGSPYSQDRMRWSSQLGTYVRPSNRKDRQEQAEKR